MENAKRQKLIGKIFVYGILVFLCIVWTIPTLGTLITSFRPEDLAKTTGWWTVVENPEFTLNNYRTAVGGREVTIVTSDGERQTVRGEDMSRNLILPQLWIHILDLHPLTRFAAKEPIRIRTTSPETQWVLRC